MEKTINGFVREWNASHRRFIFSVQEDPVYGRPTSIEIRYSAARYQNFYSTDKWNRLTDAVEAKSHGTMYVVTDEHLFERGIIEIKVASSNHNYRDGWVAGILTWIGEEFFPNKDKTK